MMYRASDGTPTAKGLRTVFLERGYTTEWLKGKTLQDLVTETLASEKFEDFNSSSSILQDARYRCVYLPKFHCELNPIEVSSFACA